MGIDVDSVSDVIDLEAGRIRFASEFGSVTDTEYIEKLIGSSDSDMGLLERSVG
jgi:hypothetical protein